MRFEFQLEAYCATQAQRDSLETLARNYANSNKVDFTTDPTVNQHYGSMFTDPMVFVEAHGTTRLGLDKLFDTVTAALEQPARGVDLARSYVWIKQVDDNGQLVDRRDWGRTTLPPVE